MNKQPPADNANDQAAMPKPMGLSIGERGDITMTAVVKNFEVKMNQGGAKIGKP